MDTSTAQPLSLLDKLRAASDAWAATTRSAWGPPTPATDFSIKSSVLPSTPPAPLSMSKGGIVKGRSGRDKVPARLTRGEAVLPVKAVKKLGPAKVRNLIAGKGFGAVAAKGKPAAHNGPGAVRGR